MNKATMVVLIFCVALLVGGATVPVPRRMPRSVVLPGMLTAYAESQGRKAKREVLGMKIKLEAGGKPAEVNIPLQVWAFCQQYAARRGMSVEGLLTMLMVQGIDATKDAEEEV